MLIFIYIGSLIFEGFISLSLFSFEVPSLKEHKDDKTQGEVAGALFFFFWVGVGGGGGVCSHSGILLQSRIS